MPAHDYPLPVILLVVLGSAKLIGEIFARLRQPALVGEILAGAVIGPSFLGWIAPNQTLTALSDLGVMFLLFDAGLQVESIGPASRRWHCGFSGGTGCRGDVFRRLGHPPCLGLIADVGNLCCHGVGGHQRRYYRFYAFRTWLAHQVASQIILAAAVIDDVLGLIRARCGEWYFTGPDQWAGYCAHRRARHGRRGEMGSGYCQSDSSSLSFHGASERG